MRARGFHRGMAVVKGSMNERGLALAGGRLQTSRLARPPDVPSFAGAAGDSDRYGPDGSRNTVSGGGRPPNNGRSSGRGRSMAGENKFEQPSILDHCERPEKRACGHGCPRRAGRVRRPKTPERMACQPPRFTAPSGPSTVLLAGRPHAVRYWPTRTLAGATCVPSRRWPG